MTMAPGLRKLALTVHVVSSVGWSGAIAAFLALAIAGLTGRDSTIVRAVYLSMQPIAWAVIVPLSLASLLTGVIQSLGTPWGLFRHYWVLIKLVITALATALLLLHTRVIDAVAGVAHLGTISGVDLRAARLQLAVDALAGLAVLLVATVLSVYKPRGLTPFARGEGRQPPPS
jgi:hypothetical protein